MTNQHANGLHHSDPQPHSMLRRLKANEPDSATALYLNYVERFRAAVSDRVFREPNLPLNLDDISQSVFRSFFRRAVQDYYEAPLGEDLWRLILAIALRKLRDAAAQDLAANGEPGRASVDREAGVFKGPRLSGDDNALTLLRLVIDEVVGSLPESARRIIELRVDGLEIEEIANRSGRSKRSVERILQRFRGQLEEVIHEY